MIPYTKVHPKQAPIRAISFDFSEGNCRLMMGIATNNTIMMGILKMVVAINSIIPNFAVGFYMPYCLTFGYET